MDESNSTEIACGCKTKGAQSCRPPPPVTHHPHGGARPAGVVCVCVSKHTTVTRVEQPLPHPSRHHRAQKRGDSRADKKKQKKQAFQGRGHCFVCTYAGCASYVQATKASRQKDGTHFNPESQQTFLKIVACTIILALLHCPPAGLGYAPRNKNKHCGHAESSHPSSFTKLLFLKTLLIRTAPSAEYTMRGREK